MNNIQDLKIRVVGLGHPTTWHCSLSQTFKTEQEAQETKEALEQMLHNKDWVNKDNKGYDVPRTKDQIAYVSSCGSEYKTNNLELETQIWKKVEELHQIYKTKSDHKSEMDYKIMDELLQNIIEKEI